MWTIRVENFQTMSVQFDGDGMDWTGKEHISRLLSFIEKKLIMFHKSSGPLSQYATFLPPN